MVINLEKRLNIKNYFLAFIFTEFPIAQRLNLKKNENNHEYPDMQAI